MIVEDALTALRDYWSAHGVLVEWHLAFWDERIELARIQVTKKGQRNKGLGTLAMKDLVKIADEFEIMISLSPSTDYGASSIGRLTAFYKRFGFVENNGRNALFQISDSMYRIPR